MLKKTFLSAIFAFAIASASHGAAIAFSAVTTNGLSDSSGQDLQVGNIVRIGVFNFGSTTSSNDAAIMAISAGGVDPLELETLQSNFTEIASTRIGGANSGVDGIRGLFNYSGTDKDTSAVVGKQVYMMALRSVNTTTDGLAVSTAFEIGVFRMDLSVNPGWAFPPQSPVPGSLSIELADLTGSTDLSNPGLTLIPGAAVLIGTFPRGTNGTTQSPNIGLAQVGVPEPSVLCLLGVSVLGLITRRRR